MSFFSHHTTKDLVAYYNEIAPQLGRATVTKFQDRATAERRCDEVRLAIAEQRKAAGPTPGVLKGGHPAIKSVTFHPAPKAEADGPNYAKADEGEPEDVPSADITRAAFKTIRPGSNREKLADLFCANVGQFVTVEAMVSAVYGPAAEVEDHRGPVLMVLKGFIKDIDRNKVPAKVERSKVGKTVSYGVFKK